MSTGLDAAGGGTDALVTAANGLGGASKPILPNAEEKYLPKLVNFVHPTTTAPLRMQLSVNGVNMPSTQVSAYESYALTRQNLQGSQYYCPEDMQMAHYLNHYFVQCLARLNISDGEYERILSGLDTRGSSADVTLTTHGISVASDLLILLECSSTVRVGQGKSIEVVS